MEARIPECWARDLGEFAPFGALWLQGDAAAGHPAAGSEAAGGSSDGGAGGEGRFWLFPSHRDDYAAEEEVGGNHDRP